MFNHYHSIASIFETCREYLLVPTDDLIIFWRSRSQQVAEVRLLSHYWQFAISITWYVPEYICGRTTKFCGVIDI